jgi:hypothetical protein
MYSGGHIALYGLENGYCLANPRSTLPYRPGERWVNK